MWQQSSPLVGAACILLTEWRRERSQDGVKRLLEMRLLRQQRQVCKPRLRLKRHLVSIEDLSTRSNFLPAKFRHAQVQRELAKVDLEHKSSRAEANHEITAVNALTTDLTKEECILETTHASSSGPL